MMYIQVAYLLESEATIEREYASLLAITDGWPRYIVTLDDDARGIYEGIQHRSAIDFVNELPE
jgi:predicted AAA+ superfamily ATPase